MAYDSIDPIGEYRSDVRSAQQMLQVAEMHRNPEKDPEPYHVQDFIPFPRYGIKVDSRADRKARSSVDSLRTGLKSLSEKG